MFNTSEERDFIDTICDGSMLKEAVGWISRNLSPEDVFDIEDLMHWADNNYEENKDV